MISLKYSKNYKFQMNIFELIANDSTGQFTSYMGMNHGLRNWVQFR